MSGNLRYDFSSTVWQYASAGGWHFVSLPVELASEIRDALRTEEAGWGRLKATAEIGNSKWDTAIWFDTKLNTYLLPIKATIRAHEKISAGDTVRACIWL